jgi:hypothetical protein
MVDTYSLLSGSTVDIASETQTEIMVTFQEFFNGSVQGSVTTADTLYAWRSSYSRVQWINGDFIDWQLLSLQVVDTDNHFLNGWDNEIPVTGITSPVLNATLNLKKQIFNQKEQLRFIRDVSGSDLNAKLYAVVYDNDFVVTRKAFINLGALNINELLSLDIQPDNLDIHTWTMVTGADMALTSSDVYVAYWIVDDAIPVALTQAKLFKIDWGPCVGYTNYEVHWVNRFDGFDSWVFQAKSMINTSVVQETFKNEAVELSGSSVVNVTSKRFVQPFHTQLADNYTLNTRNLRQWEYEGLRDLITSPEIYMLLDGNFYSVVVERNEVVRNFRDEEGRVFNLKIVLKLDNSEQRQW